MKVVVVGAGFAGIAAAFAARHAGASVSVVQYRPGASALYAGAVDGELGEIDPAFHELLAALGLRVDERTVVATREGVIRRAHGSDTALLDLAPLAGKRVGLVDVPRDDWDGPLLVRSFRDSAWARSTSTRFDLVPLELLEKSHQRRVSPFDFAASFERAERPAWLNEVLKANAGPDAWLFGPWLGVKRPLAAELSASLGVPVGEVTSPPGGVAGARFEARSDALLAALAAELVSERVVEVSLEADGVSLRLDGGRILSGDALVLAAGGFVSGAIELSGALSGAEPAGFRLAIEGLPSVRARGEVSRSVSSLFGVDLAARGRRLLEQVGLPVSAEGRVLETNRVFAAGDVLGTALPSVGHALTSGLRAGAAAAAARQSEP
ncbi:MAG TPA: FAD-binding protein [Polyangiaceae bacterium]|nr:FAD-binding protein [Polyangiaceae bacterium]